MFLFYFLFTVQSFLNSVWLSVSTWKFVAELKSINIILFSYCFFSMYGVKIFCPNKLTQQKPSFCRSLFSYLDLGFRISVTAIHKGPTIWLLRKGGGGKRRYGWFALFFPIPHLKVKGRPPSWAANETAVYFKRDLWGNRTRVSRALV